MITKYSTLVLVINDIQSLVNIDPEVRVLSQVWCEFLYTNFYIFRINLQWKHLNLCPGKHIIQAPGDSL